VVGRVVVVLAVFAVAGCGSGGGHSGATAKAASCTDRLLRAVKHTASHAREAEIRRYVEVTYCEPFARKGWVYADGSLSIKAQLWLVRGTRQECSTSVPGGSDKSIPCARLSIGDGPRTIDCAILRFVRRSEVRAYLARLGTANSVQCDDGTPLAALGVPSS
jgi:hypothetical protein